MSTFKLIHAPLALLALAASLTLGAVTTLRAQETATAPVSTAAAESTEPAAPPEMHASSATEPSAEKEEAMPAAAPRMGKTGIFAYVTNSMIVTWIVAIGLIGFAQIATRRIKDVPEGLQNFWEWMVESLYDFLTSIIGPDLVKKTFWFFATVFLFILFTNWAGLIPGVGSIGWGQPSASGVMTHISTPWFRGANADLNLTFAMSATFFAAWIVWAVQANGFGGLILHVFGPKGNSKGAMKVLLVVIFFFVGIIEVVSILFRPVSLSFRLFGNIFAGENMLETMANLGGWAFGWLLPIPFYFMELLVGIVQALVFMLLTAVFTLLITQHDEAHH